MTASVPPPRARDEREFDEWVAWVTERADPFMAWLGLLFALLVGYELTVELSAGASLALEVAGWAIWAIFLAEFVAKLWLAPTWLGFVRTHWLQAAMLVIPTLRVLRFLRLVRLGRALPAARVVSSSYRTAGTARYLFRSRLAYLGGVTVAGAVATAELAYLFERDVEGGIFASFGDALLWALAAVLGLQGDPVPVSAGGRIVMLFAFALGLVVVASLAGTVGSFLLERRQEREAGLDGQKTPR